MKPSWRKLVIWSSQRGYMLWRSSLGVDAVMGVGVPNVRRFFSIFVPTGDWRRHLWKKNLGRKLVPAAQHILAFTLLSGKNSRTDYSPDTGLAHQSANPLDVIGPLLVF